MTVPDVAPGRERKLIIPILQMEKQSQDEAATEQQAQEPELLNAGAPRGPRWSVLATDEDTKTQVCTAG